MYNFDQAWESHVFDQIDRNHSRAVAVNTLQTLEQAYQTAAQRKYNRIMAKRQQRHRFYRHLGIGAVASGAVLLSEIYLVTVGLLPATVLVLPVLALWWLYRLAAIRR